MLNFFTAIILYFHLIQYKTMTFFTHPKPSYQIIIKADDLRNINHNITEFDKLINDEKIKVSYGIIGGTFDNNKSNKALARYIKHKNNDEHYHFFNHGYTHICNQKNYVDEFRKSKDEQTKSLKTTQNIVKNKTGVTLDTFGAPCNEINDDTTIALNELPEIKYWYYGKSDFERINFKRFINIENGVGNPDFYFLKSNLENLKLKNDIIVLQIHPNMWDKNQFLHFRVCIKYLKSLGAEFITPKDIKTEEK